MDKDKLDALKAPFEPNLISWRVGAMTKDKSKGIALAYIDARDVMERLDKVCGVNNWQCRYPYKGCCEIGVLVDGQWIWKSNGAGETQVEADKGQYSDAFKRAAVVWGIGRYLYDVKNEWLPLDKYKKFVNLNDPRLKAALDNAAKGIRVQNDVVEDKNPNAPNPPFNSNKKEVKKEATPAEQKAYANTKICEMITEMRTFTDLKVLSNYPTKHEVLLNKIKYKFPDLYDTFCEDHALLLGELK